MKKPMTIALLGGQMLAAAQPALAAELTAQGQREMGAFGGFRVRLPLGGDREERRVRAGVTLAPVMHSRTVDGGSRIRFGEGLEFGVVRDRSPQLSLAGTRIDRLGIAPNGSAPEGKRQGVSTLGWVAIGVGAAVAAVFAFGYVLHENADDRDNCGNC